MPAREIPDALDAWRTAEREWEATDPADPGFRDAAIRVIAAWLRYQELTELEVGSFVLVADDDHRYVAVGGGVKGVLGYEPAELLGRGVEDITAPDLAGGTQEAWRRFLTDGRQDGQYRLLDRNGNEVAMRFQARAHHPIAGFHSSRLWHAGADR